jgi:hypothetical protein
MATAFKFLEICIGNSNKLFSDGSNIAEPAECQSRERFTLRHRPQRAEAAFGDAAALGCFVLFHAL